MEDKKSKKESSFDFELTQLINKHSLDNESKTPDYILSRYIQNCLENYKEITILRDAHRGETNEIVIKETLKIEELNHLFEEFASENTKRELSNRVKNTVVELGEGGRLETHLVQYMGMVVNKSILEKEMPLREASHIFMNVVNYLVEKGLIFHGTLLPLTSMPLAKISPRERTVLMLYVVSRATPYELNLSVKAKFGFNEVFYNEGELPTWEYPLTNGMKGISQ